MGVGQVIKGWDIAFASMKIGEHAVIVCKPDYAYGKQDTQGIPGNSTLYFDVELLDFDVKKLLEKMTFSDRINKAMEMKEDANVYFREKKLIMAITLYDKAVTYVQWVGSPIAPDVDFPMQPTPEESDKARELIQVLYTNKALTLYKGGEFAQAIESVGISTLT